MRVGIDVSPLTCARTGVGHYVHYLLKHLLLASDGCAFRAFSSGWGGIDLGGLPESGFESHRHLPLPTRALYQLWKATGRPRVDALLGGVDVFHATNYFLPPVRTARRVLSIYDLAFLKVPHLCSPKIVGPFARNVPRFAREADAILTCSEATKRDLVELLDLPFEKITVAYGAVDDGFAPVPRDQAAKELEESHGLRGPFVLFVSTLEPRKNIEGLLRAFAAIKDELPHQLVLVGAAGWGLDKLPGLLAELGLEKRVTRVGYVPGHQDLARFYGAADAFVFPSLYEGFGLPVVEAMTCGCPVITSDRSSLPEVAGDAAEYVNPDDPGAIAEAMRRVLGDTDRRAGMCDRGLAQAKRFHWQECAQTTLDVYRRAAGCAS